MGGIDGVTAYQTEARRLWQHAPPDDLVLRHLWLPFRFLRRDGILPVEEQLAIANLALVQAARAWPCSQAKAKGYSFGHFAGLAIRKAIGQALREALPAHVSRRDSVALRRLRAAIESRPEGATDAELAADLGWPVERVQRFRQALAALSAPESLDTPALDGEEIDSKAAMLPDPDADTEAKALRRIEQEQARQHLTGAIEDLSPLARAAISLRFGIPTPGTATLAFEDVLRVAVQLPVLTHYGTQRLRKRFADA